MFTRELELMTVVIESHRLLRHYAELLNMHDGGERKIPEAVTDWIDKVLKDKK